MSRHGADKLIEARWTSSAEPSRERREEDKAVLNKHRIWDGIGSLNTEEAIERPLELVSEHITSIQAPYGMQTGMQVQMGEHGGHMGGREMFCRRSEEARSTESNDPNEEGW